MKTFIITYLLWMSVPCECTQPQTNPCEQWKTIETVKTVTEYELARFNERKDCKLIKIEEL